MKKLAFLIVGLSFFIFGNVQAAGTPVHAAGSSSQVRVATTPELSALATGWIAGFAGQHPEIAVGLNTSGTAEELRFCSDFNNDPLLHAGWKMIVGRDVIVPVINAANPMLPLLKKQGMTITSLCSLFGGAAQKSWSEILTGGQAQKVNLVLPEDAEVITGLREWVRNNKATFNMAATQNSTQAVLGMVEKDPLAIGFCKLDDLMKSQSNQIALLPLDKNGNGRMDSFENIYTNLNEFAHGVWIGKYPSALCNNLYAVAKAQPGEAATTFLTWILQEGQTKMGDMGYCALTTHEIRSNLAELSGNFSKPELTRPTQTPANWPVALTVALLSAIFAGLFFYSRRRVAVAAPANNLTIAPLLLESVVDAPKGIYFDKTHTWAFMEQDGNVRIGVDSFLQHLTGKISKVGLKEVGEKVRKGEKILTIMQDGKQLILNAPVTGVILARNQQLLSDGSPVNNAPFTEGWVYQIEPQNWLREVQFMFMGERYTEWLRDELARFKDFIAATVLKDQLAYSHVVLQDGGELSDHLLAEMGPEIWEEFQTRFINTSR
ncbi:MAG: hypothetical protein LWW85_10285 [Marinilabiliales bacterium]|nr:hypothetical protein [Marinilabiliales bacterium]